MKEDWPPRFWRDPVKWARWKNSYSDIWFYVMLALAYLMSFGYMVASSHFGWYKD